MVTPQLPAPAKGERERDSRISIIIRISIRATPIGVPIDTTVIAAAIIAAPVVAMTVVAMTVMATTVIADIGYLV
jgi:hypothetical protein